MPNDPRRTRLGATIRRFSIDEFPQLVNVLVGEMSLVGPRPERPEFVAQYANLVPRYRERHMEKAGMTGWAQVNGLRGETKTVEQMRLRDYPFALAVQYHPERGDGYAELFADFVSRLGNASEKI